MKATTILLTTALSFSFVGTTLASTYGSVEPIANPEFQFTRAWLRSEAARLANPRSPAFQLSKNLNLPPSYLLIHRVTIGSIGVLCQLGAEAPYRTIVERWQPGFARP